MADTTTTPSTNTTVQAAASGVAPQDPFDYEAWQKRLGDTISKVGEVSGTPYTGGFEGASDVKTELGQEAIKSYGAEYEAMQKQAAQAQTGLELTSEATFASMQRLDEIRNQTGEQFKSAMEGWDLAAEKADEYVQASRARVGETLAKLDEINEQIGVDRDFAKAHAMQASAQAVLGSMKAEERNILQTYGADSKEYEQFRASKSTALASAQSNIHANYQQFAEQQAITYLNATNEAMWKQNMYTSFQEQQHVEMIKYMSDAKAGYAMQHAQFQIGVEQLKMAGMENLANWIIQTPSFTMDSTPLITLLAELSEKEIIGYEPTFQTSSMGGRTGIGGPGAKAKGTTTGSYQDKPVYA
jgi:hypothetical protein